MIRKKQERGIIVDLIGPDGNAFYLLGLAQKYGKQMGLDVKKITNEMKAGDYENLIKVFDDYFGHFITLER